MGVYNGDSLASFCLGLVLKLMSCGELVFNGDICVILI